MRTCFRLVLFLYPQTRIQTIYQRTDAYMLGEKFRKMKTFQVIIYLFLCTLCSAFQGPHDIFLANRLLTDSSPVSDKNDTSQHINRDTIAALPSLKLYTKLIFQKTEHIKAAPGTKSVLFNKTGKKLYAMNLEGMSIYEFDQASRLIQREFKFKQ